MKNLNLENDIKSAMKLNGFVKFIKISLAFLIFISYAFFEQWLTEIIVISVIISLILPLGFFDVFIQKLLEYNTQTIEERQSLNAQETNEHFENIYNKIEK